MENKRRDSLWKVETKNLQVASVFVFVGGGDGGNNDVDSHVLFLYFVSLLFVVSVVVVVKIYKIIDFDDEKDEN